MFLLSSIPKFFSAYNSVHTTAFIQIFKKTNYFNDSAQRVTKQYSKVSKVDNSVVETEPQAAGAVTKFRLRLQVRRRNPCLDFYLPQEQYISKIFIAKLTNLPNLMIFIKAVYK
jgi:hypothetical protein